MDFVCKNCFSDDELKGFILSQNRIGKCDFCQSDNIEIINIEELLDFFKELFGCFQVVSRTESKASSNSIYSLLVGEWSLLANNGSGKAILNRMISKTGSVLSSSETFVDYSDEINSNVEHWHILKNSLKCERRYIPDIDRLEELGWDGFFQSQSQIDTSSVFYRARVHEELMAIPIDKASMYCPPSNRASAGRANPIGIPYLYLSDNEVTVLHEVRALYHDEVTIGSFKLRSEYSSILIADFTEPQSLYTDKDVSKKIKSTLLKKIVSKDLSEPIRRFDSGLDYIPTQFICEYIKVITAVRGIKFRSSLHNSGMNFVIFDQNLMECTQTKKVTITQVEFKYQ